MTRATCALDTGLHFSAMEDPMEELQDLFTLQQPPDGEELTALADRMEQWSSRYVDWHRDLMQSVAKATLARHRQVLERVSKVTEAEAIATLQQEHKPEPVIGEGKGRIDGAAFYAGITKIYDSAVIVGRATHAFLDVLQKSVDPMLGSRDDDDNDDAEKTHRPLRLLANVLVSVVLPFLSEVERLEEGTAHLMGRLGRHPEETENLEANLASHVAMLANGGHSDGVIARILSESCPEWAASALARARQESGGGGGSKVTALEVRRVQELLKERVRKMRAERGVPSGRDVRSGAVDPLRKLAEVVERDPEADDDDLPPGETES